MEELRLAARNPWYVLMTLYGEQTDNRIDKALHEKNRRAWNLWVCLALSDAERRDLSAKAQLPEQSLSGWGMFQDEVLARFRDRLGSTASLPGAGAEIDLSMTRFLNPLCTERMVFPVEVSFQGAVFERNVSFGNATFAEGVSFYDARFLMHSWFGYTCFSQPAWFKRSVFCGDAEFCAATFLNDASFENSTFARGAVFSSASFDCPCYFGEATFASTAVFSDCRFERSVSFRQAQFLTNFPDLSGATLPKNTEFTAKDRVRFENKDGSVEERRFWPERPPMDQDGLERARENCAKIRHAIGQQGLPEEEQFFFCKEMALATRIGGWSDRLPYLLFGWLSGFGASILIPSLWLLGTFTVSWLIYLFAIVTFGVVPGTGWTAAGLSFANTFSFLGLQKTYFPASFLIALPGWIIALGAAQSVLGIVGLFFLGLGLRTRFRLR